MGKTGKSRLPCWDAEADLAGCKGLIAGVDEAGRGALFGPVVAAAVILPDRFILDRSPIWLGEIDVDEASNSAGASRAFLHVIDGRIQRGAVRIWILQIGQQIVKGQPTIRRL